MIFTCKGKEYSGVSEIQFFNLDPFGHIAIYLVYTYNHIERVEITLKELTLITISGASEAKK